MTLEANNLSSSSIDSNDELIRLVTSNADVTSQYVIFKNGYNEIFAVNVAKVEELIVNKNLNIAKRSDDASALVGVAKIRDNMCSIIHFDKWLGRGENLDVDYELIIVCNFSHQRLGIVIQSVIGIINIEADKLIDNSKRDPKTAQITEIHMGGENKLCIVFNSDLLITEMFPETQERELSKIDFVTASTIHKKILFADDSKIVQKAVTMVFDKMNLDYEVFDNGQELLNRLEKIDIEDVGLILSDIEMPVKDGMALLREVKANPRTRNIHFVMNTNMANPAIVDQARIQGADYVIKKLDVEDLERQILKYAEQ